MFEIHRKRNINTENFLKQSAIELEDIQSYFPILRELDSKKTKSSYKHSKIEIPNKINGVLDYNPRKTTALINGKPSLIHIKQTPLIDTLDIFYQRLPTIKDNLFLPNKLSKHLHKKVNNPYNRAYTELICMIILSQLNPNQFPVIYDYYLGKVREYKEIIDDDDISDDEEMDELVESGYMIERQCDDVDEYTLIHPTMPVLVTIQEKLYDNLDDIYEDILEQLFIETKFEKLREIRRNIFDKKMKAWILQMLFALKSANETIDFVHNDLHIHNVMGLKTNRKYIKFQVDEQIYKVPTYGYVVKIIDFGRSTFRLDGKLIMSDVFDKDSEAGGQYSGNLNPSAAFDLSRFACSFFEDLEDDEIETVLKTNIGKLLMSWTVSDCEKINFLDIEGFDLYLEISRNFRKKTANHEIDNQIFESFKV